MDFKLHFEHGWQNTLKFIGPALLLTFVQIVVTIITFGILAPVTAAGYIKSLLMATREGRTPEVKDLFSEMRLFLPLFGFGLAVMIVVGIGFMFLVLPGVVLALMIAFASLYMIPLMVDRRLGLIDALKSSWEMAVKNPVADHAVITIVYVALLSIGGSIPFAILLTQPLATFILLSVYLERQGGSVMRQTGNMPPPPPPIS